jgi:hypothetical protein
VDSLDRNQNKSNLERIDVVHRLLPYPWADL